MDCKLQILILIVFCGFLQGAKSGVVSDTSDSVNDKLATSLETLFKSYFSSSFLWQNIAHYLNRSELALPGFSKIFFEFYKVDRQQANRVLELTAQRGFKFKKYFLETSDVPVQAIQKYKNSLKTTSPCTPTKFKDRTEQRSMFTFIRNKSPDSSFVPRAYQLLQLTRIIEDCNSHINMNSWKTDPQLKRTMLREFLTEREHRMKYIVDLLQKLKNGDAVVEFFLDKTLKSTPMKY